MHLQLQRRVVERLGFERRERLLVLAREELARAVFERRLDAAGPQRQRSEVGDELVEVGSRLGGEPRGVLEAADVLALLRRLETPPNRGDALLERIALRLHAGRHHRDALEKRVTTIRRRLE